MGVTSTDSQQEIKKRFRALALKYHPDKNRSSDAHQRFIVINEAYQFLIDPQKRKLYDDLRTASENQNSFTNQTIQSIDS